MHESHRGGPNHRVLAHRAAVAMGIAVIVKAGLQLMGNKQNTINASPISGRWHDIDLSGYETSLDPNLLEDSNPQ